MITVEFKDFDDMAAFARRLVSGIASLEGAARAEETEYKQTERAGSTVLQEPEGTGVSAAVMQQSVQPVSTTTAGYTADDLARAALSLMDSGRQAELIDLLTQFGVESLVALPEQQYGTFATALRGLGAQI